MGPIWGRQDPGGPHVGPVNFAIWGVASHRISVQWRHLTSGFTQEGTCLMVSHRKTFIPKVLSENSLIMTPCCLVQSHISCFADIQKNPGRSPKWNHPFTSCTDFIQNGEYVLPVWVCLMSAMICGPAQIKAEHLSLRAVPRPPCLPHAFTRAKSAACQKNPKVFFLDGIPQHAIGGCRGLKGGRWCDRLGRVIGKLGCLVT